MELGSRGLETTKLEGWSEEEMQCRGTMERGTLPPVKENTAGTVVLASTSREDTIEAASTSTVVTMESAISTMVTIELILSRLSVLESRLSSAASSATTTGCWSSGALERWSHQPGLCMLDQ